MSIENLVSLRFYWPTRPTNAVLKRRLGDNHATRTIVCLEPGWLVEIDATVAEAPWFGSLHGPSSERGPVPAVYDRVVGTSGDRPAGGDGRGLSPFDTAASAATRFAIEIAAWTAGPWAAADLLGAWWWAIPALIVLVSLPAAFNTPGDKKTTGIPTPGPVRILIEMLLLVAAVAGAWLVWPGWLAVLVTIVGVALLATGLPRYRWLANDAAPQ